MAEKKETRTRAWTFVVYPESVVPHWREFLDEMHIEWVESPLHDKDTCANGEPKKPHIHVMLNFGGVKSYDQVFEITDHLNVTRPERVHNQKALVRYMAHLDDPNKAPYNVEDIVAHGGIDLADLLRPTSSQKYTLIAEMQDFVDKCKIREFCTLNKYARMYRHDDWFPLLCDGCALIMVNYIKSCRHSSDDDKHLVDPDTGEVLF